MIYFSFILTGNCPMYLDITSENLASFNLRVEINSSSFTNLYLIKYSMWDYFIRRICKDGL